MIVLLEWNRSIATRSNSGDLNGLIFVGQEEKKLELRCFESLCVFRVVMVAATE
jgi:hypothetical protein